MGAHGDRTVYATMASGGRTWLMRGDLEIRRMEAIGGNVECPSLADYGRRIAYKKRIGGQWRLQVLDLGTGARRRPAGVARCLDHRLRARRAIFRVPADGTGRTGAHAVGFVARAIR